MLARFFILAFALCWVITIPIALTTQKLLSFALLPSPLQWLIGFAPIVAAWWVVRKTEAYSQWKASLFRWRVGALWWLIAIATPWLLFAVGLALGTVAGAKSPEISFGPSLAVFALVWLVLAFGEEAGWRGFALPRMIERFGFWKAATLLGVLWCVWHYPKLFCSPFIELNAEAVRWVGLFSLQIFLANYVICWLFVRTRSVIVCTLFHASFNVLATAHVLAAIDVWLTLTIGLAAVVVAFVDRRALAQAAT
jgi:uncharacterized protein